MVLPPALLAAPLAAASGKWTPEQLLEHEPAWLAEQGLEVPVSELWDPDGGGGLLEATVQIGGCTAGMVSPTALLLTNHHCVFSILQEHSTPERDLTRDGFVAAGHGDELPATGIRAEVPHRFVDVTAEVEAAARDAKDDLARFHAIERQKKLLVARCEERPYSRCRVATDDDGVAYRLIESREFPDVRLVYAPPKAVGEFGGEVDNWSWPRHTGDFALLRIYADGEDHPAPYGPANRPYQPRRYLRLASQGVQPGNLVVIPGYPSKTYRSLIAAEMAERYELFFPARAELLRAWIDLMEAASAADETARIALADRVKRLLNREKNARGQIAGIARGKLLEEKRQLEAEVLRWAAGQDEHRAAVDAYRELEALEARRRATWDRAFLLDNVDNGPRPLDLALTLVRWAVEREKPDLERNPDYQERNRDKLLTGLERDQKRIHLPTEKQLLVDLLARTAALPEAQRVPAAEAVLASGRDRAAIVRRVDEIFAGSQVPSLEAREAMFKESVAELRARRDPLLELAFGLYDQLAAVEEESHRREGAFSRLRPTWRRALRAYLGRPLDPDANGTLRVSLGRVEGYRPRDAVWMEPQTTLGGALEKHTGEPPFVLPEALREAAARGTGESRWADPELGDVPVAFLATGDTTGGNSGSPVLDARGQLVGVNFDRVWENVANDFGYDPDVARNVSADVRYLLWILEETEMPESRAILEELGVAAQ